MGGETAAASSRQARAVRRGSGRGGVGGPVAVPGSGAVGAGRGGGAVGIELDRPAPAVDPDEVVEDAEQDHVGQAGPAALGSGLDVVDLAGGGFLGAAGGGAVPVAGDDGAAQVRGDGAGRGADVQGQG